MINRYPGTCSRCQSQVAAGNGSADKVDGKWILTCARPCAVVAPKPKAPPAAIKVGELSGILALFATAKRHLKFPAIVLGVPELGPDVAIRINVAGERAAVPGSLTVVDANRNDNGDRAWLGRILLDGVFKPSSHCINSLSVPEIAKRLAEFSADPARVAGEHGRLTGKCCFCHIRLTDERSTAVGYGKICADHFGLPWGARPHLFAEAV